jgi:two-component system cell cycle sensor histidine kinase/response regulator CckA
MAQGSTVVGGLSIRTKLFLLVTGLLAAVTIFYSVVAYREVRLAALNATEARLNGIATQWAQVLATGRQQQLATLRRLADSAAVLAVLAQPYSARDSTSLTALRKLFPLQPQRLGIQIISADGRELVRLGDSVTWADPAAMREQLATTALSDTGTTSAFRVVNDSILFASAVRLGGGTQPLGYLVEWRRISSGAAARDQINQLFGGPATHLMLANNTGDVWTDLATSVQSPNVDISKAGPLQYRHPGGKDVIAIAKPVAGTPWRIVVEYDSDVAFAQGRQGLGRLWLIGGLALLLGSLGAILLSVSLTRPLARLTRAAEGVARGDYKQQSGLAPRRDELGRLASAFDSMVARVQESFAARSASEERYRTLFESVPLPQWVYDRDSLRILAVNEAAIEHYGYSRAEFLGMSILDLLPPEDAKRVSYSTHGHDGEGKDAPRPHVKRDGTLIEVETSGHSIDFDGVPARIAIMNDVTARNRAAQAVRQSEEKYRRLVHEAPIGVTLSSLLGRFIVVNPGFVSMLGHASEEAVLALEPREVYASEEQRQALLARFHERGRIKREEIQLIRKDGTLITTQFTGRLVTDDSSGEQYVEATWEDVTEQRRVERQFQQAQKMEAVGQLAGGIAHDFNNLLTIIISSSDLVLADGTASGTARADLEAIRTAGKSAATLTRQLLAFSRQQVLQPRVMQMNDLLSGTGKLLDRLIGENIELITVLAPDAGTVKVDPGQIEQVIVNLAVNARDAMPNGGRLTIESKNIEFSEDLKEHKVLYPAGKYVSLTVSDTGIGMDSETQSRVFEPFFTTKEPGEGTGLGLATVYGIVRQSGGFISVYSEPGQGTSFKIYFPRVDPVASVAEEAPRALKPLGGHETILVVEDAPAVRGIIRQVLTRLGYQVLEAHDGESAIALSTKHKGTIDLLLTDVIMPRMGGRVLADQISKQRPGIRVLYVSGYTDDAIVRHGVLEPGVNYLEKPFTPDTLAKKVRGVLERAAVSSS